MRIIAIYIKKFFLSKRAEWRRFDSIFMYLGIVISVAALCTTFIIFEGYENTLKKTILGVNSHIYFFRPGADNLSSEDYQLISEFLSGKEEVNRFSGAVTGQAVATFRQLGVRNAETPPLPPLTEGGAVGSPPPTPPHSGEGGSTPPPLPPPTAVGGAERILPPPTPHTAVGGAITRSKGCFFKSVDWWERDQASIYHSAVAEGTYELHNENDIVVGKYLADMLGAGIGDEITILSTSAANVGATGLTYRTKRMRIVGIFYCGMYEYDSRYVFMNTETARHFDTSNAHSVIIEVQLKEEYINSASELAREWDNELRNRYQVSSWIDFNGNLFSLLALEKWVLTFIISFLIVVASFNVITTTFASISDKRKEIGLLKTIGLSGRSIAMLFLAQINLMSTLCIVAGILTGIGLGYLISYQTMISLRGEVYLLDKIYIYVDFGKMCLIFAIAFVIINISSILPIRQISRLREIEILRYRK